MENYLITGIQQIGIGVTDVYEAWKWYRKNLGFDIPIFDEKAVAALMLPYTDGKPRSRHAVLTYNLQGGGGLEIWQYTERTPQKANFEVQLGDIGIFVAKINSHIPQTAHKILTGKGEKTSELLTDPQGKQHFYLQDPYGNYLEIIENPQIFANDNKPTGGVAGAVIGVTDIDKSLPFYQNILKYDKIVYDKTGIFDDFAFLPGGKNKFRRVLLTHSEPRKGAFSRMFGQTWIELVQVLDREPKKIYQDRLWGDLGYIHLCFDVVYMENLKKACEQAGHPFTVDSAKDNDIFDMGEASGRFAYVEDPDGVLIEFVETYKIPVLKQIGWYLNLRKRNPEKPLPNFILKTMKFNRIKD